jgi:diacylglycerol kinase (ATP)
MQKYTIINIKRLINATGYTFNGLKAAFKNEEAFRLEVALFIILAPIGFWLGKTGIEKSLLIGVLFIVLIVEILNSAIEALVDRIGTEYNELSKRAKDMGSAAVFLSLCLAVIVWGIIICF